MGPEAGLGWTEEPGALPDAVSLVDLVCAKSYEWHTGAPRQQHRIALRRCRCGAILQAKVSFWCCNMSMPTQLRQGVKHGEMCNDSMDSKGHVQ